MTQEEQEKLTQQAMENAKKARPTPETQEKDVKQKEVVMTVPTVPTPVKPSTEPKIKKLLDNQRKLGDRIVTLSPWAGKTKKKFKKEFQYAEDMNDIDLQKIVEILVYDHIKEDYQLTEYELQYLLSELKEMSIGGDIDCEVSCKNCNSKNKIKSTIKKAGKFTPDTLPAEYNGWSFTNIKRSEFIKAKYDITSLPTFDDLSSDLDIEVACKVSKDNKSAKEMLDLIDETPIKELSEVMDKYVDHLASYTLTEDKVCSGCGMKTSFDLDIITGIFKILAK